MKGGEATGGDDRLQRFAEASIANIRETAANVARDEFDAVARLLSDPARPVHVLGGRFTDPIAEYFVAHLRVLRPHVRRIEGGGLNWLDQLLDIGRRDLIIIFDIRRYSDAVGMFARRAAKRGAPWRCSPTSGCRRSPGSPATYYLPTWWRRRCGFLRRLAAVGRGATLSATANRLGSAARDRLTALEIAPRRSGSAGAVKLSPPLARKDIRRAGR